jgi:hypothetical protein
LARFLAHLQKPAGSVQREVGGRTCLDSGGNLRSFPASEFSCIFILRMKDKDAVAGEAIGGQGVDGLLDQRRGVVDTEDCIQMLSAIHIPSEREGRRAGLVCRKTPRCLDEVC